MSTRRLIATALLCGLAILIAGGIWLFLAARDDSTTSTVTGQVGQRTVIGPLSVTVTGVDANPDGDVALAVEMEAVTGSVAQPANGWAVFSNRNVARLDRVSAPAGTADACPDDELSTELATGQTLRCRLFFHGTSDQVAAGLLAIFGRGSTRAVWPLPA